MSDAAPLIRAATPDDLPQLQSLEALFPSDAMSRRSLRRFVTLPQAVFLVAARGDALLGNLLLLTRRDSRRARIYSVIVAPASRGLGLGRQLVLAGETAAARRGCAEVSLEVRSDNVGAIALYRSLGYGGDLALPGYYDDGADALRLSKPISD